MRKLLVGLLAITMVCLVGGVASADSWETKTPMPILKQRHTSSVINGEIYVIGGWHWEYGYSNTVEVYDPSNNTWSENREPMPTARRVLNSAVVNGKIYAIGGVNTEMSPYNLTLVEVYDPNTNSWTSKSPMLTARGECASSVVDGKIYVFGGNNQNDGRLSSVEEYDPVIDIWSFKSPMPIAKKEACGCTADGKVYIFGGNDHTSSSSFANVDEYDPATDTWTPKTPMPTPITGAKCSTVNGKIYVVGGIVNGVHVDSLLEYDPATDTWASKPTMPTPRCYHSASTVDNKMYVLGGDYGGTLSIVEEYSPTLTFLCSGFQSPLANGAVKVKKNRVIPVKAQLFNDTQLMTDANITAPPVIQVTYQSAPDASAVDVTDDAYPAGMGTDGNAFEYNIADDAWQFNLKTKNYTASGTYTITMKSGDETEYLVDTCEAQFVIK
jgi:N-acetylneuraminic acid mutarotase